MLNSKILVMEKLQSSFYFHQNINKKKRKKGTKMRISFDNNRIKEHRTKRLRPV